MKSLDELRDLSAKQYSMKHIEHGKYYTDRAEEDFKAGFDLAIKRMTEFLNQLAGKKS